MNSFKSLFAPESVAVIGASRDPEKLGFAVLNNLIEGGYEGRLYPINPKADEILGEKAYASLTDVPPERGIEIVDVFRRPDAVMPHVEEAIAIGAKAVWFQEGIINNEAADVARAAGLAVVQNHCILKAHKAL